MGLFFSGQIFHTKCAMISIDDFKKLELRVGQITSAEAVEGSEKLLKFNVNIGNETRQILAGIRRSYSPEELLGKQVVVLANLEPRVFNIMAKSAEGGSPDLAGTARSRGLESQGMILCADDEGVPIILIPEREVLPGSIIK